MDSAFADPSWDIPIGIQVYSADSHRLGAVTQADAYELLVEDGFIVHHAYAINLFDVAEYDAGVLRLKLTMHEVVEERQVS